jgi:hypothetical protein
MWMWDGADGGGGREAKIIIIKFLLLPPTVPVDVPVEVPCNIEWYVEVQVRETKELAVCLSGLPCLSVPRPMRVPCQQRPANRDVPRTCALTCSSARWMSRQAGTHMYSLSHLPPIVLHLPHNSDHRYRALHPRTVPVDLLPHTVPQRRTHAPSDRPLIRAPVQYYGMSP